MGLLRRAAVSGRGEPGGRIPGSREEPPQRRKGPGLLRRSLKALEDRPAARVAPVPEDLPIHAIPAPGAAPARSPGESPSAQLSIELADGGTVEVPMPVRVQAPPREPRAPASTATAAAARDLTGEMLAAIASLRPGVELPSRLFTAFTSILGVRKGAFLLYDPVRLVYAPWALRGFDQTTVHRMRIPLGANEAWNALANGRPMILEGAPSLAQFQLFFSSREFASISRLVLLPFIAEDRLAAVFLVTDMTAPLESDEALLDCLARAAEAGAPRVQEARAARLAAAVASGSRPEAVTPRDETARFLEAVGASPAPVVLAALSLEDFARRVLVSHQDLDPFRLHEDLMFFLGSFLSEVGYVMPVRHGRFVLALTELDRSSLDVFAHQLGLFLHGLLGDGEARGPQAAPKVLKVSAWPEDGADLRALVESLSS